MIWDNINTDKKAIFFSYLFAYLAVVCFILTVLDVFLGVKLNIFFPNDRFADFYKTIDGLGFAEIWKEETIYDTGTTLNFIPPFLVFIYYLFAKIILLTGINKIFIFGGYILVALVIFTISLKQYVSSILLFFLILISFPILFAIERGNPALLVVGFIFSAIRFKKNVFISTLFLALAVSIKITPIIFLGLICSNKLRLLLPQILMFLFWLFTLNIIAIDVIQVNTLKYDSNLFFSSLKIYEKIYLINGAGLNFGSSLISPFFLFVSHYFPNIFLPNPYIISLILFLVICFMVCKKKCWMYLISYSWLRIDILSIAFILFTPVTGNYYLLLMLGALLIQFNKLNFNELFLYFFLFVPKLFIIRGFEIGAFINPLLLLVLLYITIKKDLNELNTFH